MHKLERLLLAVARKSKSHEILVNLIVLYTLNVQKQMELDAGLEENDLMSTCRSSRNSLHIHTGVSVNDCK